MSRKTKGSPRFEICSVLTAAALLVPAVGSRILAQSVTEFPVPSGGQPESIAPGPGGTWFTEYQQSRIGRIDAAGVITEYPINHWAEKIVADSEGNLWFNSSHYISRMNSAGDVVDFSISGEPYGLALGPDRRIWFTDYTRSVVGNLDQTGQVTEYHLFADELGDIVAGPDGNLWVADFGEFSPSAIWRITPSGAATKFPTLLGNDLGICAGPDGNVWFTAVNAQGGNKIARITPSGEIKAFSAPGVGSSIAWGPDGKLWFPTASAPYRIGRMATNGEITFLDSQPSNYVADIATGADGGVWFTEPGAARIARVQGACSGDVLCLAGGRYQISVSWRTASGSGQGHPVALTAESGYFWFFEAGNVELILKILDGCTVNGRTWVFVAGLTNVEVHLTVTDTQTGAVTTYSNPLGTTFLPILDANAFSNCAR